MNTQPIQKQITVSNANNLHVHSIFPTIQGEAIFAGWPATFIRLAGCNLKCPLCDTEYTQGAEYMSPEEIVAIATSHKIERSQAMTQLRPLVVITGGEPFRQDINLLVNMLIMEGFIVQIETNGTLAPFGEASYLDYDNVVVVCSPKTGKLNKELVPKIDFFKYVVQSDSIDPDDGLPTLALEHTANPKVARPPKDFNGGVYIQPADEHSETLNSENLKAAVASSLKYGHILCLQVHKIIDVE